MKLMKLGIDLRILLTMKCLKPWRRTHPWNPCFGKDFQVKKSASSRTNLWKLYQGVVPRVQYTDSLSQGTQRPNSVGHVALGNKTRTTKTNLSVADKTQNTKSN